MSESATVQLEKQTPRTVGGRVAAIIAKLIAAAADIEAMKTGQVTVNIGKEPEDIKLIVPKQY